jgi:2-polyprenyl-3-methyl-5-hydroxy-6-metoxy-1,4-benzoquinol methylase
MQMNDEKTGSRLRILVAIASYGTANDHYLKQLIEEYRSMPFEVDIVVMSNLEKNPALDVETMVGMPNKNPWSLPFLHKKLFAERITQYDLFLYSEDDMLVTERNLRAFLDVSLALRENEVAGFLRVERGPHARVNYPEIHGFFHWDSTSIRSRGKYTLAKFTNEHAAFYALTRNQLEKAIRSGGFLVEPHEGKYDLLCSAATDPYTQCNFVKLIPVSHQDDNTIRHLSDRYLGQLGVDDSELSEHVSAILKLARAQQRPEPLLNTETKLRRGMYSKNYYDPVAKEIVSMIPSPARSVLSIGCGWGATESHLAKCGARVVAIPLDPIIGNSVMKRGVELVVGDFHDAKEKLGDEKFDCILFLNVLHLVQNPIEILSLFGQCLSPGATVIIQSPNMLSLPVVWKSIRLSPRLPLFGSFDVTCVHFSSFRNIRDWCRKSGLRVEKTVGTIRSRTDAVRSLMPDFVARWLAPALIAVAQKK